jgi:hypothetical protein
MTDDGRSAVVQALLDSGCRYAVCAGSDCDAWHSLIDTESTARYLDDPEGQQAEHVMTTSHEGENPDEVAFFFVRLTNLNSHDFRRYVVLHIGSGPATAAVDAAVRRFALDDDAV